MAGCAERSGAGRNITHSQTEKRLLLQKGLGSAGTTKSWRPAERRGSTPSNAACLAIVFVGHSYLTPDDLEVARRALATTVLTSFVS